MGGQDKNHGAAMSRDRRVAIDVTGKTPDIAVFPAHSQIVIQCEIVDQTEAGPRPSGRDVRLGLTAVDAMRLLSLLKSAQQQLGLPDWTGEVTRTAVPPAKQRN
jgi:hypothetical protein